MKRKNNPDWAWTLEQKLILWCMRFYKPYYRQILMKKESRLQPRTIEALNVSLLKLFTMERVGIGNIAKYDNAAEMNANTKNVPNLSQQHFAFCKDLANYLEGRK